MDGNFGLIESFGVDSGELGGQTPAQCFVLGYELAMVSERATQSTQQLTFTVHAENKARLANALTKRGRTFEWQWPPDDASEAWVYLTIHAKA